MRSTCLFALVLLIGCSPVKRLQRDEKALKSVTAYLLSQGICKPDTFTIRKTDTIVRVDTIGEIIIYSDTSYIRDTVRITREKLRNILKTLTIRDTLWQSIRDAAREESLVIELTDCRKSNAAYASAVKAWKWAGLGILLLIILALIIAIKR